LYASLENSTTGIAILKGKKGHMANDMVKAYTVIENCTYYVISEPSFFNAIRKSYLLQASSKPTPQPIW
jgi:hypothetical protein